MAFPDALLFALDAMPRESPTSSESMLVQYLAWICRSYWHALEKGFKMAAQGQSRGAADRKGVAESTSL